VVPGASPVTGAVTAVGVVPLTGEGEAASVVAPVQFDSVDEAE
jgi:hypothetical protein